MGVGVEAQPTTTAFVVRVVGSPQLAGLPPRHPDNKGGFHSMSRTVLADFNGFTPVIDLLATEKGLLTAAVFGVIWRYCQGKDGVCRASLETIADKLNINKATVKRKADELVEAGYLSDLTPGLRNRPHIYADTGKLALALKFDVAQSNTEPASVAQSNVTVAQSNVTVAESHLSKQSRDKEDTFEGAKNPAPSRERPEERALLEAFVGLTHLPPTGKTGKEKKADAVRYYQPIRRMLQLANGDSLQIMREAIERMHAEHLSISSPQSVESVFRSIYSERASGVQQYAGMRLPNGV